MRRLAAAELMMLFSVATVVALAGPASAEHMCLSDPSNKDCADATVYYAEEAQRDDVILLCKTLPYTTGCSLWRKCGEGEAVRSLPCMHNTCGALSPVIIRRGCLVRWACPARRRILICIRVQSGKYCSSANLLAQVCGDEVAAGEASCSRYRKLCSPQGGRTSSVTQCHEATGVPNFLQVFAILCVYTGAGNLLLVC